MFQKQRCGVIVTVPPGSSLSSARAARYAGTSWVLAVKLCVKIRVDVLGWFPTSVFWAIALPINKIADFSVPDSRV